MLYRSIRIVDGHSAQLLVRTYLGGINPFTLAQGNKFPRAHIESVRTLGLFFDATDSLGNETAQLRLP